jgi:transposase
VTVDSVPWRDLPADFGPWQTVWKRHRRFAADGTWDAVLSLADADDVIDWSAVAVDSTSCRVHQHGASLARDTGGTVELHEFVR